MNKTIDYAERALVALMSIPFLIAFSRAMPSHPYFILVAISEMLSVVLILTRRSGQIAATPYAFIIAIMGTALPLLIRPTDGVALLPVGITTAIMLAGLVLSISAKIYLNRSFGIVAANRGVKRSGPYRLVRHPMYLGYFVTQVGFVLASFTLFNMAAYILAWTFQILRVAEEEKCLMQDADYANFAGSTRWRLVPGLF